MRINIAVALAGLGTMGFLSGCGGGSSPVASAATCTVALDKVVATAISKQTDPKEFLSGVGNLDKPKECSGLSQEQWMTALFDLPSIQKLASDEAAKEVADPFASPQES